MTRPILRFAVPLAVLCFVAAPARAADASDFLRDVAPIFERHCLRCHGGDKTRAGLALTTGAAALRGSDDGAVIVPGDPDRSRLIEMISGDRPKMPEGAEPLNAEQVDAVRRWIADGARWPEGVTLKQAAGADESWWSLQPIEPVDVPQLADARWVRNPIDAFVLAKLRENGLTPSPEADRRTLIRRVTFDLTGLPPTPAEVDAYLTDSAADAYEKVVERLLASRAYGERWARHWLDVARYGESHGFERNQQRENAWHYRDWVIAALNADVPYDRFVRMQLAGDLIEPGYEGQAAVGFLVAGVHNTTVGSSPRMQRLAREDELEEIVGTTMQALVGITAQCARCHDHKFDPVSLEDYYELTAALAGVGFGERDVLREGERERLAEIDARLDELGGRIATLEKTGRQRVLTAREAGDVERPEPPAPIARWEFDGDFTDSIGDLDASPIDGARIEDGALVVDGKGYAQTGPIGSDLGAKTLEAWVQLDTLDQAGGAALSVQTLDGVTFDAIVFAEREETRWMAGSNFFARTRSFQAPPETEAAERAVHVAIVYAADGTITGYRDGAPYGQPYRPGALQPYKKDAAQVIFGLRHTPPGGNRLLRGRILRAQLYDRALTPDAVAASAGASTDYVSPEQLAAALDGPEREAYRTLTAERGRLVEERAALQSDERVKMHTVAANATPGVTKVLHRGDIENEGPAVAPSGLDALHAVEADWKLAPNAPDAARRKALAEWVTHPDNPLFHRVIVNRVWHYHFGVGLVETPNDLGYNGGRPSHPRLLDWLAARFKADGYSLKALHRLIVTSAAYRQASTPRAEALAVDANNRLLWRKTPTRMEGEVLRDTMLAVSGKLNPKAGGPGYVDVEIKFNNGTTYYFPFDRDDAELNRRTIYRFTPRGGRSALLDTFDCPDPSNTAPRRAVTTTPLQALSLMNNPFALRMADALAARAEAEAEEADARVALMYRLALGRAPDAEEASRAAAFAAEHGLPVLARVLFNTNEFVMIE